MGWGAPPRRTTRRAGSPAQPGPSAAGPKPLLGEQTPSSSGANSTASGGVTVSRRGGKTRPRVEQPPRDARPTAIFIIGFHGRYRVIPPWLWNLEPPFSRCAPVAGRSRARRSRPSRHRLSIPDLSRCLHFVLISPRRIAIRNPIMKIAPGAARGVVPRVLTAGARRSCVSPACVRVISVRATARVVCVPRCS